MKSQKFLSLLIAIMLIFGLIGTSLAQIDPDADPDRDGLPNRIDNCDNEFGLRENGGCPLPTEEPAPPEAPRGDIPPDSDGDGTADGLDRCPNEPGDGANYGCPVGTDPNRGEATPTPVSPTLNPAPLVGDCVVSTLRTIDVNIREFPSSDSAIVGVISVNEWVIVLAKLEYQLSQNGMGNETLPMIAQPHDGPETDYFGWLAPYNGNYPDPDYLVWLWVQDSNSNVKGWVAEEVIRYGGNCSELEIANPTDETIYLKYKMRDVLISSYQTGGSADDGHKEWIELLSVGQIPVLPIFPTDNPFLFLPTEPSAAAVDYFLKIDGIDGESEDSRPSEQLSLNYTKVEFIEDGCELNLTSNGAVEPSCDDGETIPSIVVCIHQQVNEVGVWEEVCYEVEIPEGCVVDSSEAGIWHITCEDDGDGVQVTPLGENSPILDIQWEDDTDAILIGLLLPAVQKVREAAAR